MTNLTMRDIALLGHAAQKRKYGDDYAKILGKRGGEAFNRKYIADRQYSTIENLNPHDDEADQYANYEKPL